MSAHVSPSEPVDFSNPISFSKRRGGTWSSAGHSCCLMKCCFFLRDQDYMFFATCASVTGDLAQEDCCGMSGWSSLRNDSMQDPCYETGLVRMLTGRLARGWRMLPQFVGPCAVRCNPSPRAQVREARSAELQGQRGTLVEARLNPDVSLLVAESTP